MKSQAKSRTKSQSHSFPSNKSPISSVGTSRKGQFNTFHTVVREGDLITFEPTGEQLKIAKIEGETITIEKLP
jgi:hypothetical protein